MSTVNQVKLEDVKVGDRVRIFSDFVIIVQSPKKGVLPNLVHIQYKDGVYIYNYTAPKDEMVELRGSFK